MGRATPATWIVQWTSITRVIASLLFSALAFQEIPLALLVWIYALAAISDLIDGLLARRLGAESYIGKIIDLVSDKSLTIVSLLYAAERGVALLPLSLIASREIIMLGVRAVVVDGSQLLPTNRLFGGVMATVLWGNTLFLVCSADGTKHLSLIGSVYWVAAAIFTINVFGRIYVSRDRIKNALSNVE